MRKYPLTQRLKKKACMLLTTKTRVFRIDFRTACVFGSFIEDAGERGLVAKEWKWEPKLGEEFPPFSLRLQHTLELSYPPIARVRGLISLTRVTLMPEKRRPVVPALFSLRGKVPYFVNVNFKIVKLTLFKRVLTNVSAMLPSSG